jgi:site-specific DNA recombinase
LTRFATPIAGKDGLIRDSSRTVESIAAREQKTERSIRMTLSLAFLSPALVKAAIEGRLSAALASSV